MPQVTILPAGRRTCEESLAFRATVSPPHLRRKLPRPVLPPPSAPTLAEQLRQLMEYPLPEPVWTRLAQRALDENDDQLLAEAIKTLLREIVQHQAGQAKLHAAMPLLYPKAA